MTDRWTYEESNFHFHKDLQGNQSSCYNQKFNTKAYLNPQIVNYELLKKSLTKSFLQSNGKIHINPNFRGIGLSNVTNRNYPHLVDTVQLNSQISSLCKPGMCKTLNVCGGEKIMNKNLDDNKSNLNFTTKPSHESHFRKINAISMKNCKKSPYSWFRSRGEKANSYAENLIQTSVAKPVEEMSSTVNCIKNIYNFMPLKIAVSHTGQTSKSCSVYKTKTKIINESKTILINDAHSKVKLRFRDRGTHIPIKRNLYLSKFVYNNNSSSHSSSSSSSISNNNNNNNNNDNNNNNNNNNSNSYNNNNSNSNNNNNNNNNVTSILMMAKAVRSKYKYLSNLEQYKESKYKIDKRNKLFEEIKNKSNKIKDIRKLFPNYFYNKVKLPYNVHKIDKCSIAAKNNCSWSKIRLSDKIVKKVMNQTPNRRVVNIGGILYKSTANKLTLANKGIESKSKKSLTDISKGKKNHVVYVRGEKFILENNGKALRRQYANTTNEKTLPFTPKRIDIGGVTYLQKSCNVLIRTNVHKARHLVNKAKNKSIALLTNLCKRSSMPCMIYHRFGRCIRHTKSLCMYKHDPKNVAVCKKFLKGNCPDNNCLLSHQVIQEKMATCHFFLKGLCFRENCPFVHVKLNKNAAICENFLQGFCNLGKDCLKRHLHQCPEFDKFGTCKLGSKCHYPHKKTNKVVKNLEQESTESLCENSGKLEDRSGVVQYFIKSNTHKKQKRTKNSGSKLKAAKIQKKIAKKKSSFNNPDQSNDIIECFPKRIKLDKLPCFIPLASASDFKQS